MREMAVDSHHHMSNMDKKMHGQHGHRRSPSSSSSSSSSSTSSSTSSSSSSSTESSPHRSGHKRDSKRKPRPSKRGPSTGDRSKLKKTKSSSFSRKHSSSKPNKKTHPSKKDHDKFRSHKSSRSPTRRKSTMSKKLLSPGRKRSPSPGSRKSHKLSPGISKRSKSGTGRKRSGSPRDRLDYRGDRMLPERSLSHGRDTNLSAHAGSSSRSRDPRVEDRMRRVSPEQMNRDRYSSRVDSPGRRYDKERIEEFVESRRDRRSPVPARTREVERKETHRHRDYERHERDHYDERRREDPRREDREREQLRERELREREIMREREMLKERERVEMLEREQERERERLRELDDRRGRYAREQHEFARDREVVLRGGAVREFEGEREFFAPRGRPDMEARVLAVDERRAYDDQAYDRFQSERERSRYESGRGRYDEMALHERRGIPAIDDRRADRRAPPIDARFQDDRRRGGAIDPRAHEAWMEDHRGLERIERPEHFAAHGPRHRHQPEWTGGRQPVVWDRHKQPRHDEWGDEYVRGGGGSVRGGEWGDEAREWGVERGGPTPPHHQDQWAPHARRGYREDWGSRGGEWVDRGPPAYPSSRDLGPPAAQVPTIGRVEHGQQPAMGRRSRREQMEQGMEPPPMPSSTPRHHPPPPVSEEEGIESALVAPRGGGDVGTPPPLDHDRALMPGNDGELWEYDPGRGSWVRRAADAPPPQSDDEKPAKKENIMLDVIPETESDTAASTAAAASAAVAVASASTPVTIAPTAVSVAGGEEKKRRLSEDIPEENTTPKRQRTETPTAAAAAPAGTAPPPPLEADIPPLQEKDTFSDISDDADDILNQEVGGFNDEDSRNLSSSQLEETRNLSRENGPSYDDLLEEEESIHLEEISDDDLEEDRQAKFSVAGALDINWAALVRDSRAATVEVAAGTALKRFKPGPLLSRLGVSSKYARPELIQRITEACNADAVEDGQELEKVSIPVVVDTSGVLRLMKAKSESRQRILDSIGPNRRALCARQDIALRRQLCNLPEQDYIGDSPLLDKDLFRQSVSLLKSC